MRLKRLTISGFKSFPKRTTISFSQGVCAIVGPNGSGKSNIVDAIRWVLGEQNPRLLRAKSMEDLIYRGNGKKVPRSAYVRLILENDSGLAPPELESVAEIEIERTLFPNGDARFRLNRKNCRLKDIRYLFLDTGAGARAYSIIDQGQVGHFVSMSPEERRLIVEEVAGISRYKARRAEAASRMRQTLQNLERLRDIISEVEKQARSLKRQAKKADRFLKLRQKEEWLSIYVLRIKWERAASKEQELTEAEALKKEEKEALELELHTIDTALYKKDLLIGEHRAAIKDVKAKIEAMEEQIEEASLRLIDKEKELALCSQTIRNLEEKLEDIKRQRRNSEKRLKGKKEEFEALTQASADKKEEKRQLSRKAEERERAFSKAWRQLEDARNRLVDLSSKRALVKSKASSTEERLLGLNNRLQRIEKQRKGWEQDLLRLDLDEKETRLRLSDIEKETLQKKEQITRLDKRVSQINDALSRLRRDEHTLTQEITALRTELSTLKKVQADRTRMPEGLGELLGALQKDGRVLADLIKVEHGWEDVVESALGESLTAVFIPDSVEMESFLTLLKKRKDEAAALNFISERLTKGAAKNLADTKDQTSMEGLTNLSSMIKGDNLAAEVARARLSFWHFAEGVDVALTVLKRGVSDNIRIITGDGFILTPWMEVRFGGDIKAQNGILWTRARIEEISQEMASKQEALLGIEKELDKVQREKDLVSGQIMRAERALQGHKKDKEELSSEMAHISSRAEGLRDRLELIEFEQEEVRDEKIEQEKRFEDLIQRVKALEVEEKETADALKEIQESFKVAEQAKKETETLLQRVSVELAKIDTECLGIQNEIKRMEEQIVRSNGLTRDIEAEIGTLSQRKTHLLKEIERASTRKQKMVDEAAGLISRLNELEEALDGLMAERSQREGDKKELLARLKDASLGLHETEMALARLRKEREHLEETCLSNFRRRLSKEQELPQYVMGLTVEEAEDELGAIRQKIERIGPVNLTAISEFEEIEKRREFLKEQEEDLSASLEDIQKAIDRIDQQCRRKFKLAIEEINKSLERVFPLLFEGGCARVNLDNPGKVLESGVEFLIEIPGKRIRHLNLLSGGEKALGALALIFSIFFIKPSPFCLLDEVDAPLDESNTTRFNRLIRRISANSQVILVTHNQRVMETADRLYGVTMEEKGISKLISVELKQDDGQTP